MSVDPDFDVVVIGGGGAGLAAAVSAAEAGAGVLIVEAGTEVGGSTALSGGSFMAAGTPQQVEQGHPGDSADAFFDHYLTFNRWDVEPAVARRFCDAALPTMEWLTGLGVRFPAAGLYRATRESAPRSHRPEGAGPAIVEALHRAARAREVDIALGKRVDRLAFDAAADVYAVHAGTDMVTARSVVVTTGGFGANRDLVQAHIPDAEGDGVWSPSAATCQGDGLRLVASLGAATAGENRADLLLSAGLVREIEPYPPAWLLIVGRHGRRIVDEAAPYAVLTPLAIEHGPAWVVLDEAMLRSAAGTGNPVWGPGTWTADVLRAGIASGRVVSAGSVRELAVATDLPAAALQATVERYNASCAAGRDAEFLKKPEGLVAVTEAPFHAVRLRPSVVALTGFGLRIDRDARVVGEQDGEPLPRLYAAGEVTGNVIGPQYLGGGNAIGSALIFGRIAGMCAAADRNPALSEATR